MIPTRFPRFLDWSLGVGRPFGIPIRLHVTILLFLLPAFETKRLDVGLALEWAAAIVLSILLHELGHALTAKRYGLSGLSITLHGFGGFASSSGPRTPKQSLAISLAGPAVTFAIGAIGLVAGNLGIDAARSETAFVQFALLHSLGAVNILLGFLNLIPSLPWDGGNALQALLAHRMPELKATRTVAHLGLVLCPILFVYGLLSGRDFVELFTVVGFFASYSVLAQTGGIRFGEAFADRKHRKEMEVVRRREEAKSEAFREEVYVREKEREEKERLRRLFEKSGIGEP